MANIDTIVTLFETVAAAMRVNDNTLPVSSIVAPTFIYNRVSAVNENVSKTYPAILLDSQPNINRKSATTTFLPKQNCYEFKLFVYDQYNFGQQTVQDLSNKQAKVETILNQYIAEVQRRALTTTNGIEVENIKTIDGFLAKDVHNSKLVQAYYKVKVCVNSDCVLGTFVY
tara:strand:- start:1447 stop:1959 length:513 start_codon:yes stop_codon:yes gene_type:complete